jgi:hypothetical protein
VVVGVPTSMVAPTLVMYGLVAKVPFPLVNSYDHRQSYYDEINNLPGYPGLKVYRLPLQEEVPTAP